jgi:hypothetical protein
MRQPARTLAGFPVCPSLGLLLTLLCARPVMGENSIPGVPTRIATGAEAGSGPASLPSPSSGAAQFAAVTFTDSELMHYEVAQAELDSLAVRGDTHALSDGRTGFSDDARDALLESMVNSSGVVKARGVKRQHGKIVLTGTP